MSIRHSPLPLCEENYSADRYVQRVKLEQATNQWLQDPKADRTPILSLVGPPGSGKSWLLAHMQQTWKSNTSFVLSVNARHWLDPGHRDQVKHEIIGKANAACTGLNYPYDEIDLSALIADLSVRLCSHCAGHRLLVLVDGCDDLTSQEEFDRLQNNYLKHFFGAGIRCLRMIVARRLQLTYYDLRQLSTLPPLTVGLLTGDGETDNHRGKLSDQLSIPATAWPPLPAGCTYGWNHPYINCYLVHNSEWGDISTDILANCCRALIERSQAGHLAQDHRSVSEELRKLASITQKHPARWTSGDFRATIGEDLDDAYRQRGLISERQADNAMLGPTYHVVDGLRELLAVLPEKELRS